jgi:arsenate reductase (thioredoxin)
MTGSRLKPKFLFVCSRNAGRSQMAEGFLNAMYGDLYRAYSAGISPASINPLTIRVMQEAGIDISHQTSKALHTFCTAHFAMIVVLCNEECSTYPVLPDSDAVIYQHFPDPKSGKGDEEEVLREFRAVRDEIGSWVLQHFRPPGKGGALRQVNAGRESGP